MRWSAERIAFEAMRAWMRDHKELVDTHFGTPSRRSFNAALSKAEAIPEPEPGVCTRCMRPLGKDHPYWCERLK